MRTSVRMSVNELERERVRIRMSACVRMSVSACVRMSVSAGVRMSARMSVNELERD